MPGTPRRRLEAPATCIPDCKQRQSGQATLDLSIIHQMRPKCQPANYLLRLKTRCFGIHPAQRVTAGGRSTLSGIDNPNSKSSRVTLIGTSPAMGRC